MNSELNRIEASKQYFELRNALNRANRIKNLKTELEFELRENDEEYFIIIKSTESRHGLRMASFDKEKNDWVVFDNEKYTEFFKYMFKKIFTLKISEQNNLNKELTGWLARLWVS